MFRRAQRLEAVRGFGIDRVAAAADAPARARPESLGFEPAEASRLLLEESAIAATGTTGWGAEVASRYVRFVFSAESPERLGTIPERVEGTTLAAAVASRAA